MIKFYDIDENYIHFLQQYEKKVPNITYESNNKFVCGVVLSINGINYYAPISHFNKAQRTNFPIRDKGKIIATVRLCFMFPALLSVLHEKDFTKIALDNKKYTDLLNTEYTYCNANLSDLLSKAQTVYNIGLDKTNYYNQNCCDFAVLESHYKDYDNNINY